MVVAHENDASFEHITKPKMVYISMPTENGTIYSKAELEAIYEVCKKKNLILYIDGARLGYAMMCKENDVAFSDLPNLCDAFYIGGTKVGALFGEALVIVNECLQRADFSDFSLTPFSQTDFTSKFLLMQ